MLKSSFKYDDKLKLLCNQLNDLNLFYLNQNKRTTTTRITPRGPRPRKVYSHSLIFWNRIRSFPPNWKDDHHVFYPSLKEYLEKKKSVENYSIKYVNIGYKHVIKADTIKEINNSDDNFKKLEKKEDILGLIEENKDKKDLDYYVYNQEWLKSCEGVEEINNLAIHYNIYDSLFETDKKFKKPKIPAKVDFDDFFPRPEQIYEEDLKKYFPGSLKLNEKFYNTAYYFDPVVPIHVEFTTDSNESSFAYRGNVIEPQFASKPPNIVLDNSFFSKENVNKLYEELVDIKKTVLTNEDKNYYTVALINLDNNFKSQKPICHYMISNIDGQSQDVIYDYLPVYGVKGLGYNRYTFVVFKHEKKLNLTKVNDFDLKKREFNTFDFIQKHKSENLLPVGLNWFQSKWDESCKDIFHNYLKTRMPVYEYKQIKEIKNKQIKFPAPASFNNYLDRYRDPKEIKKEVLLERLNNSNPFNYAEEMKQPTLPPNIYKISYDTPDWYKATIWKRRNRLNKFRDLRPHSAILPHNNNADLDKPFWPHPDKVDLPMRYPFENRCPKPLKDTKWAIPPNERPTLVFEDHYNVPEKIEEEAKKIYDNFKIEK